MVAFTVTSDIDFKLLVRNPTPKVIGTNASVILTAPVAAQNNVANVDGPAKTTQAGMSGIQALAAAAAATQKITVSPQASQIKIGISHYWML